MAKIDQQQRNAMKFAKDAKYCKSQEQRNRIKKRNEPQRKSGKRKIIREKTSISRKIETKDTNPLKPKKERQKLKVKNNKKIKPWIIKLPKTHKWFHIELPASVDHFIWILQDFFKKDLIWCGFWTLKAGKKNRQSPENLPEQWCSGNPDPVSLLGQNKNVYFFFKRRQTCLKPLFLGSFSYPGSSTVSRFFAPIFFQTCSSCLRFEVVAAMMMSQRNQWKVYEVGGACFPRYTWEIGWCNSSDVWKCMSL